MWLALVPFLACSRPGTAVDLRPEPSSTRSVRQVDATALKAALDAHHVPVLIDVRSPAEYAAGHVPGARSIPVDQLAGAVGTLGDYAKGEVWLICESGGRSARAAELLSAHGFATVDVSDGTSGWRAAGFPVER